MVPFLVELGHPYDPDRLLTFDPHELVRFALSFTDYWAELALGWLTAGLAAAPVAYELRAYIAERKNPQRLRHAAGRLLKSVEHDT